MIVDSHQHVWDLTRAAYPWLDSGLAPIDRTMDLEDALPAMRRAGVDATVLVQATDSAADTANMLRVAAEHPEVVGVVAWVPLDEPQRAADMLDDWRHDPHVVGVRNLLHARPDTEWVLRDDVDAGLGVLEAAHVTFDYVTDGPATLAHLPIISERHPELAIVIDHLGKPPVGGATADRAEWRRLIEAAAGNPRVFAKVSGLYSSTGKLDDWTLDDVRPFFDDAVEVFGAERLMFGSDWPISVLAGGYDRTWEALHALGCTLGKSNREAFFGGTAASFYSLDNTLLSAARLAGKER